MGPASASAAERPSRWALPRGPKLQFLNLSVLFTVVLLTVDYPNPLPWVVANIALAGLLDAVFSRWRFGSWRVPWPTLVAALGITLLLDLQGPLPFLLLPALMVGSKHLIRWRGRHLFNPNNFAAVALLLLHLARVGVNDWGAAPQTVLLMLVFGTIATVRVDRFDLALAYLGMSFGAYGLIALAQGWGLPTVWMLAFSPLQVVLGFFAITDPATSPGTRREKLLWAALLVLLAVPATLAGRVEGPILALFLAAPQRHLVKFLADGTWPPKQATRQAPPAASASTTETASQAAPPASAAPASVHSPAPIGEGGPGP